VDNSIGLLDPISSCAISLCIQFITIIW